MYTKERGIGIPLCTRNIGCFSSYEVVKEHRMFFQAVNSENYVISFYYWKENAFPVAVRFLGNQDTECQKHFSILMYSNIVTWEGPI